MAEIKKLLNIFDPETDYHCALSAGILHKIYQSSLCHLDLCPVSNHQQDQSTVTSGKFFTS